MVNPQLSGWSRGYGGHLILQPTWRNGAPAWRGWPFVMATALLIAMLIPAGCGGGGAARKITANFMMHVTVQDAQGHPAEGRTVYFSARTVDASGGTTSNRVFNTERNTNEFGMVSWGAGFDVE